MRHIFLCTVCRQYTLQDYCPLCKAKTVTPKPARFSPADKYGRYRRMHKQQST